MTASSKKFRPGSCGLCRYLHFGWTCAVMISLAWNLYITHNQTIELARIEARTIFAHNMAYRKWNTRHGGVYVKLNGDTRPNPYLAIDDRDLITASGAMLTLINPFQMTREAYELLRQEAGDPVYNRTVSASYLNPDNAPDTWEQQALADFNRGSGEVSEITEMQGVSYMRLMRPYITYKGCIKCHDGYDVGDIRGGMSISVPMQPYLSQEESGRNRVVLTHLILWLLGLGSLTLLTRNIERSQFKIAESEKKFRVLAESANDWEYWVSDQEGIVFMSPSCEKITGYTREEFQQTPYLLTEIIHQEDRTKYSRYSTQEYSEDSYPVEIRIRAKDGSTRWLSHVWRPIYIDGIIMGRRVSNRDITAQKQLETQLYQVQKMDAIGSLTGGIAHDFNNILTAILGYSLLSLKELPEQSPVKKNIEGIYHAGEKAAALTRQLLAFSRKQVLNMQTVNLCAVVTDMEGMILRLIGEDIRLKVCFNQRNAFVNADRTQLDQVLLNLVVNARDAMPEGGQISIVVDRVRLDSGSASKQQGARAGDYICLRVSDSGEGIPKEIVGKIFEPFYTTKAQGKGTGLGLATVYGIIKQHNGTITVDSEPGRGTQFTILLPAVQEGVADEVPVEDESLLRGAETILVVDDEQSVCALVADVLRPLGYTVVAAPCASEAIKLVMAGDRKFDLVLTDVVMPGMNGRELVQSLAGLDPGIKALYMSGHADNIITPQGRLDQGAQFVGKPFTPNALVRKIREVLD
ncbi:MAG: ATP-binding protein [Desulfobulbaceae bacterium]